MLLFAVQYVSIKDKHVPPPGYDHEAIMAPYRALDTHRRRARREREVEAMTASIEAVSGRRGAAERAGDAPTYQDARDIFAANGDILLNHDYCVYVGLTKQSLQLGLRGEQGRFLTASRERNRRSTNTQMVQLARINQRTMHCSQFASKKKSKPKKENIRRWKMSKKCSRLSTISRDVLASSRVP